MRTDKGSESQRIRVMAALCSTLAVWVMVAAISLIGVFAESAPAVSADAAVVMSGSTGEIVYGLHDERKLPVSGTAKLMAAMVVLDRIYSDEELDNIVQITRNASHYGDIFSGGDQVSVRDLLYLLLLKDSDEAAITLGRYSAGSRYALVDEMNAKAVAIGLRGTHYENVGGSSEETEYQTVRDAAVLMREAMRYPLLREILSTKEYAVRINDRAVPVRQPVAFSYTGLEGAVYAYGASGMNYAASAKRDGMEMITVVFGGSSYSPAVTLRDLLNYGFRNVTRNQIVKADKEMGKIKVRHGEVTRIPVYTESKGYVYVPEEGSDSLIRTQVVIDRSLTAPVEPGTRAGELKIYVADEETGSVELIVKDRVEAGWFPSWIYISNRLSIAIGAVLLVLLIALIRIRAVRRRRRRLREERRRKRIRELALEEKARDEDRERRNWKF